MNYKLIKQLEEVGFKKKEVSLINNKHFDSIKVGKKFIYKVYNNIPTLSELIEALQNIPNYNYFCLFNDPRNHEWIATVKLITIPAIGMNPNDFVPDYKYSYVALSPEEAVASLYIKLNSSKVK